jgi:hypothetical protein
MARISGADGQVNPRACCTGSKNELKTGSSWAIDSAIYFFSAPTASII